MIADDVTRETHHTTYRRGAILTINTVQSRRQFVINTQSVRNQRADLSAITRSSNPQPHRNHTAIKPSSELNHVAIKGRTAGGALTAMPSPVRAPRQFVISTQSARNQR
eukprot:6053747-Prymnesium_polylepis.1